MLRSTSREHFGCISKTLQFSCDVSLNMTPLGFSFQDTTRSLHAADVEKASPPPNPRHHQLAPGIAHCCYLLALLLMVFQSGQVSQVALQGLNTLLLLPVLLGFLLTFLFQIINMFITTLDLLGRNVKNPSPLTPLPS